MVIVIIGLMLLVYICPKVITFKWLHIINSFNAFTAVIILLYTKNTIEGEHFWLS